MANRTILIVDDDSGNLKLVKSILIFEKESFNVLTAQNGQLACEIARKELPDLIIMDWDMPIMDGLEATRRLQQNPDTKLIPIIIATGVMMTSEDLQTALEAGAVDYVRKPIDKIELLARVNSILKLSNSFKKIHNQRQRILNQTNQLKIKNIEIETQKDELKKLDTTKNKMFSIIGHDLRGPVGSIRQMLEVLLTQYDSLAKDEIAGMLKMLELSASSTYSLLENLLMWSKFQKGEIQFFPDMVDLFKIVEENIILLISTANNKSIDLYSEIMPDTYIFADLNMINAVIRNLISNAIKFTSEGGIVKIYTNKSKDKNYLNICVEDTGIGITESAKQEILNRSSYFSTYGTHKEKGSGIGLMLCIEFIEKHGGILEIDSTRRVGSKFIFSMPVNEFAVKFTPEQISCMLV